MSVLTTRDSLSDYKRMEKLGEGTYGVVYKARHKPSNRYVALKRIKIDPSEEGIPATTLREVSLLKELRHECIIHLEKSLYVDGELYLVFEFMDNDLKQYLDNVMKGGMDQKTLKKLSYQLLEGVRHCHSHRVLHRDLKPQNLLISADGVLKLADFGLGREHGLPIGKLTHEVVTLWYRPPEILLGQEKYSNAADVWGVGCIIAEMATKSPLFPGDSEIDQLFHIFKILGTPNEEMWPGVSALPDYKPHFPKWSPQPLASVLPPLQHDPHALDFIAHQLRYVPHQRLTAKEMLNHPWFDDVRDGMNRVFSKYFKSRSDPSLLGRVGHRVPSSTEPMEVEL